MEENKNNKKTLLLLIMLIAIIVVLFIGVIYQFVVIKSLQRDIASLTSIFHIFIKNI